MTVETRDSEFRHPEVVAFLRSLTDEEAAKHPPLVREHDGVATHCWREGEAGKQAAPTPCSPPDAASKTCVVRTSSNGGLVAVRLPHQKT